MEGPGHLSERVVHNSPPPSPDTTPTDTADIYPREIGGPGGDSGSEFGDMESADEQMDEQESNDQNNNKHALADDKSALADDRQGRFLRARSRRRLVPEKIRHKRQTLQDMARPLKQWLYQHKDNPYPSKSEKVALAAGSHMTLIQVSNWFANARRRLKNTVREPNLSWSTRIKLYNTCVVGNAERFSVSSEDAIWDSEDEEDATPTFPSGQSGQMLDVYSVRSRAASTDTCQSDLRHENICRFSGSDDSSSHIKYKNTILQRYLNDHFHHPVPLDERDLPRTRDRRQSGSMGSRDYEEMSTSSTSSPFDNHHNVFDDLLDDSETHTKKRRIAEDDRENNELYWKTIDAALALTNLARSNQKI